MKTFLVCTLFLAIGFGVTADYLREHKGKFIIVRNTGTADITYGLLVSNPPYSESTDERVARAGSISWIVMFARIDGPVRVRCRDGAGDAVLAPRPDSRKPLLVSLLVLENCRLVKQQTGFAF